ncbi:MAG: alpha/beta hydrolase-fold protein [Sandaracinaceae bacterium]
MLLRRVTPVWAALVLACGSPSSPADGGSPDLGLPVDVDQGPEREPSLALTELVVDEWRLAWVPDGEPDRVFARVLDGSLTWPAVGTDDALRVEWEAIEPGEEGELVDAADGTLYFLARLTFDAPVGLSVQADGVTSLHLGGAEQPGDVRGTGRLRVPLHAEAGENLLVVRAFAGRGAPRVRLWWTDAEAAFNPLDVTAPEILVGTPTTAYLGVPVLELTGAGAFDVEASVVDGEHFEATTIELPSLPAGAVTQVPFELRTKSPVPSAADETLVARLSVRSSSWARSYETEIELRTVPVALHVRTFRSRIDGSAQLYAVQPPPGGGGEGLALVLSLHGAAVQARNQAASYGPKDWAYIIAPTNRRPFGFDWEDWGRLDALEVLEEAQRVFATAPDRVYLTGHSMGGHGTWQLGTLFPGRFSVVGPSAGWSSFYTYTGRPRPEGPFARSRASSDTNAYVENLRRRSVYIIHGAEDRTVPPREARDMRDLVGPLIDVGPSVPELGYHEEPGAGHWWNGDRAEGADCVDWPPLFARMESTRVRLDQELDFTFRSPSPFVSPDHAYVHLRSAETPYEDLRVTSSVDGTTVTLTTENVRSMVLDGRTLADLGVTEVVVDGEAVEVRADDLPIGPQDGKAPGRHGPLNEALSRPFCFVYDEDGPAEYRAYAGWLTTHWAIQGNGLACAVPTSRLDAELRASHQLVYLGVPPDEGEAVPIGVDGDALRVGERRFSGAAAAFVYPDGDRVRAYVLATPGQERLLFSLMPFASGSALPDFLVFADGGVLATGFFDPSWGLDPTLAIGL